MFVHAATGSRHEGMGGEVEGRGAACLGARHSQPTTCSGRMLCERASMCVWMCLGGGGGRGGEAKRGGQDVTGLDAWGAPWTLVVVGLTSRANRQEGRVCHVCRSGHSGRGVKTGFGVGCDACYCPQVSHMPTQCFHTRLLSVTRQPNSPLPQNSHGGAHSEMCAS